MAAYIEMTAGDHLIIGKSVITLERKAGQRARLAVETSENIEHVRADDAGDAREARPALQRPRSPH